VLARASVCLSGGAGGGGHSGERGWVPVDKAAGQCWAPATLSPLLCSAGCLSCMQQRRASARKLWSLQTQPLVAAAGEGQSASSCRVHAGFAVFSWGVAEWACGRVKETNMDVSQARLFRTKAGQGVAHCNPAAANMEQYARLPRNSVHGHRGAEVALERPPSPSICEGGGGSVLSAAVSSRTEQKRTAASEWAGVECVRRPKQTAWLEPTAWECPHLSKATVVPITGAAAAAKPQCLACPLAALHNGSAWCCCHGGAVVARVALHSGRWPVTGLVDCLWMCSARRADGLVSHRQPPATGLPHLDGHAHNDNAHGPARVCFVRTCSSRLKRASWGRDTQHDQTDALILRQLQSSALSASGRETSGRSLVCALEAIL
jgi:hypothetical protein